MTDEQKAAYIFSEAVSALTRIEGMRAENMQRAHRNESMAYVEDDFVKVGREYFIGHNAALSIFNG